MANCNSDPKSMLTGDGVPAWVSNTEATAILPSRSRVLRVPSLIKGSVPDECQTCGRDVAGSGCGPLPICVPNLATLLPRSLQWAAPDDLIKTTDRVGDGEDPPGGA